MSAQPATQFAAWYKEAYGRFAPEVATPGHLPFDVFHVRQDAHSETDEMGDALCIGLVKAPISTHMKVDVGGGWVSGRIPKPGLSFQPSHSIVLFDIDGRHELTVVSFSEHLVAWVFGDDAPPLSNLDVLTRDSTFNDTEPEDSIAALWLTVTQGGPTQALRVDALFQIILVRLFRCSDELRSGCAHALSDAVLSRAVSLMHERMADGITIGELAAEAGLSPWQFTRSFEATTGRTVDAFLAEKRVSKARRLRDLHGRQGHPDHQRLRRESDRLHE
ncbi:AraC family transcriptional regulator [uncultured Erythrobacter sp.]|uniref:helix-turn-helix domain-containing protein n=1 Tax=uncultured Erythrobacter sp. TaxID=263913 RepID=UPI0026037D19|nr:AraC family transcriptional regulator [uncultured Erythrobacter sp.]